MNKPKKKKVVYLAGPITGVENYWEPFENADDVLSSWGFIVLNPARLPQGMTREQYMRICHSMIDCADIVLFLPHWYRSEGATVEWTYCKYNGKTTVYSIEELLTGVTK